MSTRYSTVTDVMNCMWQMTIKKWPHLAVIDDDNYIHLILTCNTEKDQDMVLNLFLQSRGLSFVDGKK